MTTLNKPIKRKVNGIPMKNSAISVTLYPSGFMGFRELRSHREYLLPITTAYRLAIEATRVAARRTHAVKKS